MQQKYWKYKTQMNTYEMHMGMCTSKSGFPPVGAHGNSFGIFGPSMGLLGARRSWKMIVKHMALSSFNMSSFRAIWTHFISNFMIFIKKHQYWIPGLDLVAWSWTSRPGPGSGPGCGPARSWTATATATGGGGAVKI